ERSASYSKEINITLTEKGWKVFKAHDELHGEMDLELSRFMKTIPEEQFVNFIEILENFEKYVDKFLEK
ncbi:MAG TPA: hypothetical protein PKK26_18360, partial [Candidatus Wallbacteria bacterium]|nr:hypothetical protein [Candidatus Wallbacteria bacterium]